VRAVVKLEFGLGGTRGALTAAAIAPAVSRQQHVRQGKVQQLLYKHVTILLRLAYSIDLAWTVYVLHLQQMYVW
jgi:hypothetical protein